MGLRERVITIPRLRFFGIFLTDTRLITHAIHVLLIYIYIGGKSLRIIKRVLIKAP